MNMFKPTKAKTVTEYFSQIDEPRKSEVKEVHNFIRKSVPKLKPFIQHNIVGYGFVRYKTKLGREGDWFKIGLASQKNYISIYLCGHDGVTYIPEEYKKTLGKADIGKSCIRFKKFEDLDKKVLKKALKEAL